MDMYEAIAAGDGTLHGAIDYWQDVAIAMRQQLAESQAREKVLRDAVLTWPDLPATDKELMFFWMEVRKALDLPHNSTALDEAIRQAKREALLDAAEEFKCEPTGPNPSFPQFSSTHVWGVLRKMADDLKS